MEIGQKLKDKRLFAGLSQEALAQKIGVTRQTISNWENNRSYPDIASVLRLSDLYSVSLDELLKEDENMRKHVEQSVDFTTKLKQWLLFIAFALYPVSALALAWDWLYVGAALRWASWVMIPVMIFVCWKTSGGKKSELAIGLFFVALFILGDVLGGLANGYPLAMTPSANILVGILMIYAYGEFLGKGLRFWLMILLYFILPIATAVVQKIPAIQEQGMFYTPPEPFGEVYQVERVEYSDGGAELPIMVELAEGDVLVLDGVALGEMTQREAAMDSWQSWRLEVDDGGYLLDVDRSGDYIALKHYGDASWCLVLSQVPGAWFDLHTSRGNYAMEMDWYHSDLIPGNVERLNSANLDGAASAAIRLEDDTITEIKVVEEYHHNGQIDLRTYTLTLEDGSFPLPDALEARYEGGDQYAVYSFLWQDGEYLFRVDFE